MVQKKEKQWSPVGCVQGRVLWFCCCMYFPAPRRLLLCLCCNVLLLCVLLAGRACCWLANCAGRVLHGSHCNALLSHYPLQERSPRAPRPSTPHHLSTLPFALPFFLPPTPTHMQSWVNRAPPALRTDGCRKRQEPCFLLLFTPRSLSLIPLLKHQFFPLLIICPCSAALLLKFHLLSLTCCISKNAVNESGGFFFFKCRMAVRRHNCVKVITRPTVWMHTRTYLIVHVRCMLNAYVA